MRANFITSVDGGATADGKSGALAGPGDRFIFNLLRELADVIVVGAGTVRIEGYSGAHLPVAQRQQRQARGQSEVPQLAIVTKSGRLDRDMGVFTRTEVPPLVLTCTAAVRRDAPSARWPGRGGRLLGRGSRHSRRGRVTGGARVLAVCAAS